MANESMIGTTAWDRIGNDPALANARRKLSIHEIRLIIVHAQARHAAVLKSIISDPHGCRFCDYGKLRNPAKEHDEACGYSMAAKIDVALQTEIASPND